MKLFNMNIQPKNGVGKLKFGMFEEDVLRILGKPEVMIIEDEQEDTIYGYESIGINLICFDKEEDKKLVSIELSDISNAKLWDIEIFKKDFNEIDELVRQKGYTMVREHNYGFADEYEKIYTIALLNINMYFNFENRLKEINLGVYINSKDKIEWAY